MERGPSRRPMHTAVSSSARIEGSWCGSQRDTSAATSTWPKGTPDKGETPEQTALREVREETGIQGRIVGALPLAYRGTGASTSAFFLMVPEVAPGKFNKDETIQVRWVSFAEAAELFKLNHSPEARNRDRQILDDAYAVMNASRAG